MRVPLGGRRVRGHVVELGERPPERLKPITGVSGDLPVFGPQLRDALVWAAHHYLAPVSVMLERAAPPNLPTQPTEIHHSRRDTPTGQNPSPAKHPLDELTEAVLEGRRRPITALLSPWEDVSWLEALTPIVGTARSLLIVVATASEADMVARHARRLVGENVIEISGDVDDATTTERWSRAASQPGHIVIGTPRVATWPVAGLAVAVVVEESRRAMKDRQTPTLAVRRLMMTRGRLERFSQVYVGPTPSLELLAAGAEVVRPGPRAWPLVEVVDRNEEPPGSGLVSARARTAIARVLERDGTVFVFSHRRGYAPAYRCATCKELRRCANCGSRPEPGEACTRCGAPSRPCLNCGGATFEPLGAGVGRVLHELKGLFGDRAGETNSKAPVGVGSERDLASTTGVELAIAVDVDGLALGSHFRAGEEALRILARLAGRVRRGRGNRLILQTSLPDQPLVTALRRGDPMEFLTHEMAERRALGYPPASEIMVIEVRGGSANVDGDLRATGDDGMSIMGPAPTQGADRWLVQGAALGGYKLALRPLVQRWRDQGATVRVDVDPLDL